MKKIALFLMILINSIAFGQLKNAGYLNLWDKSWAPIWMIAKGGQMQIYTENDSLNIRSDMNKLTFNGHVIYPIPTPSGLIYATDTTSGLVLTPTKAITQGFAKAYATNTDPLTNILPKIALYVYNNGLGSTYLSSGGNIFIAYGIRCGLNGVYSSTVSSPAVQAYTTNTVPLTSNIPSGSTYDIFNCNKNSITVAGINYLGKIFTDDSITAKSGARFGGLTNKAVFNSNGQLSINNTISGNTVSLTSNAYSNPTLYVINTSTGGAISAYTTNTGTAYFSNTFNNTTTSTLTIASTNGYHIRCDSVNTNKFLLYNSGKIVTKDSIISPILKIGTTGFTKISRSGTTSVRTAVADSGLNANSLYITGGLNVGGNSISITSTKTPANATDIGIKGQICWDANYLYICTATDTWTRIPLTW